MVMYPVILHRTRYVVLLEWRCHYVNTYAAISYPIMLYNLCGLISAGTAGHLVILKPGPAAGNLVTAKNLIAFYNKIIK